MDVFRLRHRLVDDYGSYVSSFIRIKDDRIEEEVRNSLGEGLLPRNPCPRGRSVACGWLLGVTVRSSRTSTTTPRLDILLARRLWNFRSIAYNTMQYAMFIVMRDIRGKGPEELAALLNSRLDAESERFGSNDHLQMHQQNRRAIHYLLARITDHVERSSGYPSRFVEYMARGGKDGYEVEHVWANKPERHTDEFPHPADFQEYRHRIGGLLLLPKSFNASYGDLPYDQKLPHYNSQNLLARSLHPGSYDRNPGFLKYAQSNGVPFKPHEHFKRADLDQRQALYREIAEEVWNPARLEWVASA